MVSVYTTEAPPPATRVQILPSGFKMVSLRDAPDFSSRSFTNFSSGVSSLPKGAGNSISPQRLPTRNEAVSSRRATRSSGWTSFPFSTTGLSSR